MTAPASPDSVSDGDSKRRVVLITGLSGAGMSVALKALEDLGFEAVDNLRLSLVSALIHKDDQTRRPIAIVIDSRTRDFTAAAMLDQLERLVERADLSVRLLFLDCTDEVLQRRFTETRRRHPLAGDRPVSDGIRRERDLLQPLVDRADVSIDTTELSIHDLRRLLEIRFELNRQPRLQVSVTSFSFRRGLPREADLVFDVRFLVNPHYVPELRPLNGSDAPVAEMVAADPDFPEFFRRLTGLLEPLLPRYQHEGKSYLTIAVGCTGGRHRSVFVAERLAGWLRSRGIPVTLYHRDLERSSPRPG
jgi:UPF0042 nucleotide-binding protein